MDCDRSRHSFPSSIAGEIDRRLNKNSERNRGGTTTNTLTSCVRWQEIHDRSPAHKWRRYISTTPPNSLAGVKGALQCGRSDHNHSTKLPEFSAMEQFFSQCTSAFATYNSANFEICLNSSWNVIWNFYFTRFRIIKLPLNDEVSKRRTFCAKCDSAKCNPIELQGFRRNAWSDCYYVLVCNAIILMLSREFWYVRVLLKIKLTELSTVLKKKEKKQRCLSPFN